jgi:alpha-glucosidase
VGSRSSRYKRRVACAILAHAYEIDFRNETADDCLWFYLHVKPETFARYVALIDQGAIDTVLFSVGSVEGFYSDWSPSISTPTHGKTLGEVSSPDGRIRVLISTGKPVRVASYRVLFDGKLVVGDSQLGLQFSDANPSSFALVRSSKKTSDETYEMPFGKTRQVRDHYNEATFDFEDSKKIARNLQVTFRVFDDGVGFRYSIPEQRSSLNEFTIREELTQIVPTQNQRMIALPLPFNSSYEEFYKGGKLDQFAAGETLGLPLLLLHINSKAERIYLGVTEAALTNYANLLFVPHQGRLDARLAPWPDDPQIKVRGVAPFSSPWRVLLIGRSPATLLESNVINNLNAPSVVADTSWIHPGKIQFPWWNGYVVPHDPDHKAGLNTWTLKHYIDFCAANKIEYNSLDGYEMDQAWYGGKVIPYEGADITKARHEIDLPEVLRYAKSKGIRTRAWFVAEGLIKRNIEEVFSTYERMGIDGIMVDFLNRDDQKAVQFYNDVLKLSVKHHLTVAFHGIFKPAGLARTYPNLLTQEAVLGLEYDKWLKEGSPPDHEVLIAFIRMMAGPLDTHEGSFRPVPPAFYKPHAIAPNAMGTLVRQLAMYVVYENHQPMLADYPEAYLSQPSAFEFVKKVPVTWEESKMVLGKLGKYISLARRAGKEWYIGTITDQRPRHLKLPLKFLGQGNFTAEIYSDGPNAHKEALNFKVRRIPVTAKDVLDLEIAPAGGSAIHIF